jgi:hypothetical protein
MTLYLFRFVGDRICVGRGGIKKLAWDTLAARRRVVCQIIGTLLIHLQIGWRLKPYQGKKFYQAEALEEVLGEEAEALALATCTLI